MTSTEATPELDLPEKEQESPGTPRTVPSEADEDEDYSLGSYTTLLSSNYDSDEESEADDNSEGQKPRKVRVTLSPALKLKRSFSDRDEILEKLAQSQSARYIRMLYGNERAVRKASIKKLESDALKKNDKDLLKELDEIRASNKLFADEEADAMTDTESWFMFEYSHTLPGFCILILYCICHMSMYEVVCNFVEQWMYDTDYEDAAYVGIFLFALFLIRLSGGIWDWVDKDSYNSAKFDTHNRLRLNKLDAQVLLWFKRHERTRFFVTYLAFYLMLVCVNKLHDRFGELVLDRKAHLLANLPSRNSGVETLVARRLKEGGSLNYSQCESWDDACLRTQRWEKLDNADEEYVFGRITPSTFYRVMGDIEGALVPVPHAFAYHVVCIGVAMFFLGKMNFDVDH